MCHAPCQRSSREALQRRKSNDDQILRHQEFHHVEPSLGSSAPRGRGCSSHPRLQYARLVFPFAACYLWRPFWLACENHLPSCSHPRNAQAAATSSRSGSDSALFRVGKVGEQLGQVFGPMTYSWVWIRAGTTVASLARPIKSVHDIGIPRAARKAPPYQGGALPGAERGGHVLNTAVRIKLVKIEGRKIWWGAMLRENG